MGHAFKALRMMMEKKMSEEAVKRFKREAREPKPGDRLFKSRKEADEFLKRKART